ncbi:2131f823-1b88-402b-a27d-62659c4c93e1 [Thermothielavioides terrestris]|uniref:F-box domain-containing protein n=2 Tax=Thermothielavioides terrestris TaxID=2587410 RepID=G2R669_THETT|nr:uncharacterized protein THITE_2117904 [Thermothielavioides terrestris NRRL 8126]AEO68402.1 hypothetical protein THITE_2117904 [Thermothielavioides terrestris NRRL 8126]SPQ24327.1 2131f823-1b88-402b-a27d-62659c4c93e1 [Thermothielavioides terrestris]
MSRFTPQSDEGYSEDPLTAQSAATSSLKSREDAAETLAPARSGGDFPPWLIHHLACLSISRKTELAMALLNDLPTSVVSDIVRNLSPRLYIDFVRYLPPEVCLKILGYLDPVSLINVARCCRAWYSLALDRKLWEQLYYLEGWKALPDEIAAAEREMNAPFSHSSTHGVLRRMQFQDDGRAYKKRAISLSPALDADTDTVMVDAASNTKQEQTEVEPAETSIFGGPRGPLVKNTISRHRSDLDGQNAGLRLDPKGKGKAFSTDSTKSTSGHNASWQTGPARLAPSTLWLWDDGSAQFRINWKYLYTMRRRLESNWERGRYTNFQFPPPDHLEDGHGDCVYTLQYNSKYLVSGSRDRTLKVWDMKTHRCLRTLAKHKGSVLCLQFDSDPEEDIIVSGSSDSDIVIWKFSTGKPIQTLRHAHRESVLSVRFDKRILVSCSKDKTIKVFNRKPLRHGDLGYQEVNPVARTIKDYGHSIPMTPDDFPVIPAWTMIACMEGHSAAVNALQIHGREVVSVSGDRHIKVWDWPTQVCSRTIVGHNKGIACVQYDGRRIVSGSSDNEVKVFDRQTGLEVASLRSHSNLVRTIQAGFGDLPYSVEDDLAAAKQVDQDYFRALESGLLTERARPTRGGRRIGNAGSRRPEDICAYGAKLPPGGGGGKYGRIVSGSYDTNIIIWRRDKEGLWKDQYHLKQETALLNARAAAVAARLATGLDAAGPSTAAATPSSRSQTASAPPGSVTGPGPAQFGTPTLEPNQPGSSTANLHMLPQIIDNAVQGGQLALAQAIEAHPAILGLRSYVEASIDRQQNPVVRSQLRQTFSTALIRAQFEQGRQRREALRHQEALAGASSSAAGYGSSQETAAAPPAGQPTPDQLAAVAAHQAHAHVPHGAPLHQVLNPVPAVAPVGAAVPASAAAAAAAASSSFSSSSTATSGSAPGPAAGPAAANATPTPMPPQPPAQPQAQGQPHFPHVAQAPAPLETHDLGYPSPARVFKLQFDARRIICCSQRCVILGWDFCNGDPELEEASRFFGHVD